VVFFEYTNKFNEMQVSKWSQMGLLYFLALGYYGFKSADIACLVAVLSNSLLNLTADTVS